MTGPVRLTTMWPPYAIPYGLRLLSLPGRTHMRNAPISPIAQLSSDCSRPSCAGLSSNLALKPAVLSVRAVS